MNEGYHFPGEHLGDGWASRGESQESQLQKSQGRLAAAQRPDASLRYGCSLACGPSRDFCNWLKSTARDVEGRRQRSSWSSEQARLLEQAGEQ